MFILTMGKRYKIDAIFASSALKNLSFKFYYSFHKVSKFLLQAFRLKILKSLASCMRLFAVGDLVNRNICASL